MGFFLDRVISSIEKSDRPKLLTYLFIFFVPPLFFHILDLMMGGMSSFQLHLSYFVTGIWLTEYLLVNHLAVVFSQQAWEALKPLLSKAQINQLRIEEEVFQIPSRQGWFWLIFGIAFGAGTVLYLSTTSLTLILDIPIAYLAIAGSAGSGQFFVAGFRIFRQLKKLEVLFTQIPEIDLWNLEAIYSLALFPAKVVLVTLLFLFVNPFFYIYVGVATDPFVAIAWIVFTLFAAYVIISPLRGVNRRLRKEKRSMLEENSDKIKVATQALYVEVGSRKKKLRRGIMIREYRR